MSFSRQHILPELLPEVVRAKWPHEILREGFVPMPKRFLRAMVKLFPGDEAITTLAVILAVVDFRRPHQLREPSKEFLGHLAGMSEAEVTACLARLVERGWARVSAVEPDAVRVEFDGLENAIKEVTPDGS